MWQSAIFEAIIGLHNMDYEAFGLAESQDLLYA